MSRPPSCPWIHSCRILRTVHTNVSEAKRGELFDTAEETLTKQTESEQGNISRETDIECVSQTSDGKTLDTYEIESTVNTLSQSSDRATSEHYPCHDLDTELDTLDYSSHSESESDESYVCQIESCSNCGASTDEDHSFHVTDLNAWVFFCSDKCKILLEEKYLEFLPKPKKLPPEKLSTKTLRIPDKGMLNMDGSYG